MREFATAFYNSTAWKRCRRSYLAYRRGLCERCLKKGIYTPAVIVHHKVYLDPKNIGNPEITMNFENLEALCHRCHDDEHYAGKKRYRVDDFGHVEPRDISPPLKQGG